MIDWRALLAEHPDAIRPILAGKVQDRRAILRWRAFILATHRDRYTVAYLTQRLWLGRASGSELEFADRLDAEIARRC